MMDMEIGRRGGHGHGLVDMLGADAPSWCVELWSLDVRTVAASARASWDTSRLVAG